MIADLIDHCAEGFVTSRQITSRPGLTTEPHTAPKLCNLVAVYEIFPTRDKHMTNPAIGSVAAIGAAAAR